MNYNSLLFILIVIFTFFPKEKPIKALDETHVTAPSNILKSLWVEHPRLMAHSDDFKALKNRINSNSTLKDWDNKLIKRGEQLLSKASVTYNVSERKSILKVSRVIVDRIYTLAMLYQLHGDKKYGERAWQELQAASQFPDWNPSVFLDVAEMTHAFAIGYDWLYQYWTPEQRNVLREQIIKKGLSPAKMAYNGDAGIKSSWVNVTHNWNLVCNGGIGIGALAIADTDPELSEYILKNVLTLLPNAMKRYGPDGAWNEGMEYWNYGTRYTVAILASLESALNTDFDLEKIEGFSKTGLFALYMNGPTNQVFNFSDGADPQLGGAHLFWLANKFDIPLLAQHQKQKVKTPDALDLLWYSPDQLLPKKNELPLAAYFRYTEVMSMRSFWDDKNAWFVGFKAGDNKANHSHLDLGSFVLDAFGKRWAVDLGSDNYSLPDYFGKSKNSSRWSYYRTRAEGHNTLVLNPSEKYDQDPSAETKIQKFEANGNSAFAIADLTPAYHDQALSINRGITLVNGQTVVLQDEIRTKAPSKLYWFMHTPAHINIQNNAQSAILKIDNEQIVAEIISPAKAVFTVRPATPLVSSAQARGVQKQNDVNKLTIYLNDVTSERIVVSFHPLGKTDVSAANFYKPLKEWKLK